MRHGSAAVVQVTRVRTGTRIISANRREPLRSADQPQASIVCVCIYIYIYTHNQSWYQLNVITISLYISLSIYVYICIYTHIYIYMNIYRSIYHTDNYDYKQQGAGGAKFHQTGEMSLSPLQGERPRCMRRTSCTSVGKSFQYHLFSHTTGVFRTRLYAFCNRRLVIPLSVLVRVLLSFQQPAFQQNTTHQRLVSCTYIYVVCFK